MTFAIIIGILASLAATVFLCIKVLPAKFDGTFSKKPLQMVHDYFNFKKLYLETVLKVLFTLLTVTCIIGGLLVATVGNVFQLIGTISRALEYGYAVRWIWSSFFTNLFGGLGVAVLGPVVLRLVYEGTMMFILLVKNTIEINNKMKNSDEPKA